MSRYQVQKLLFNLHNNLEVKQKYKETPQEILKRYDLAESELARVKSWTMLFSC